MMQRMPNKITSLDTAMTLLFQVGYPRRGASYAGPSPRIRTMRQILATATALVLVGLELHAADRDYEQRFSELLANGTRGFVSDTSLVDTNNIGPVFGDKPLPFLGFRRAGELGGIRLGMTMSQV